MTDVAPETPTGGDPMIHGTLQKSGDRPALRFEHVLSHPVERVWRAVSVPAELGSWFPAAVEWTPAVGESFDAGGATLEVTAVDPQQRLAWVYAGQLQSFELAPEGQGCRLTFTHVLDDRALAAQTAAGWETYLSRLQPHLDGRDISEQVVHRRWAEIHERYAELFGVDPTPGRRFAAALRTAQHGPAS